MASRIPLLFIALVISFPIAFLGCKKKDDECVAGQDGNLKLRVKSQRNGNPIKGSRFFIKFNAKSFPGSDTSIYDLAFSASDNSAYVDINNLNCGNYYVYAIGIDSLLEPDLWTCKGGLHYNTSLNAGFDSLQLNLTNCNSDRTGRLDLIMKFFHHTKPIKGVRVFVKYDAIEFPGSDTTLYDYAVSAPADSPYATIDSLSCGRFYIYAVGIDSQLDPQNWVCTGGLPYSTSMFQGTDSINVYITEGD